MCSTQVTADTLELCWKVGPFSRVRAGAVAVRRPVGWVYDVNVKHIVQSKQRALRCLLLSAERSMAYGRERACVCLYLGLFEPPSPGGRTPFFYSLLSAVRGFRTAGGGESLGGVTHPEGVLRREPRDGGSERAAAVVAPAKRR